MPPSQLYASDLFPEYEDLSYELWRDQHIFPPGHYLTDDVLASNDVFLKGNLMTKLGPGQMDIIAITMFLHLFDYANQLRVATRILRLLSHKPGSLILGSQAGVTKATEQALKPPFDRTSEGEKRTVFRHSPESFTAMWEEAGAAAGVPLRVSAVFQKPDGLRSVAAAAEVDAGLGPVKGRKKNVYFAEEETRRLYFSVIRT